MVEFCLARQPGSIYKEILCQLTNKVHVADRTVQSGCLRAEGDLNR